MSDITNENIIIDKKEILSESLALVKVTCDLDGKNIITEKHLIEILSVSTRLQEIIISYLRRTSEIK